MNVQSFDATLYKAKQRQSWDSVANGWKKWWPILEQATSHVSDVLEYIEEMVL